MMLFLCFVDMFLEFQNESCKKELRCPVVGIYVETKVAFSVSWQECKNGSCVSGSCQECENVYGLSVAAKQRRRSNGSWLGFETFLKA